MHYHRDLVLAAMEPLDEIRLRDDPQELDVIENQSAGQSTLGIIVMQAYPIALVRGDRNAVRILIGQEFQECERWRVHGNGRPLGALWVCIAGKTFLAHSSMWP